MTTPQRALVELRAARRVERASAANGSHFEGQLLSISFPLKLMPSFVGPLAISSIVIPSKSLGQYDEILKKENFSVHILAASKWQTLRLRA